MALYPVAGSKIYIGGKLAKHKIAETDFSSQVWVEIGGWTQAGALGVTQGLSSSTDIPTGQTLKAKGAKDGGTMENTFRPIPTDPGQIALKAAADSCASYAIKVDWAAGCDEDSSVTTDQTSLFTALILPGIRQGGDANALQQKAYSFAVNSNILEI